LYSTTSRKLQQNLEQIQLDQLNHEQQYL